MLKIDILTLFPEMFRGPFDESIIQRAQKLGLVEIKIHNLRKWGVTNRQIVDDRPYGGGVGMLIRVDIVASALDDLKKQNSKVIILSPAGKKFEQNMARKLSKEEHLILICGHYEGFDQRIIDHLSNMEISIGDYVLTGGELPAMVITDTIARLVPGVLPKGDATEFESFTDPNLLEGPQYTRPEEFNGWKVPEVLLTGHHDNIQKWRNEKAKEKTKEKRPDLM